MKQIGSTSLLILLVSPIGRAECRVDWQSRKVVSRGPVPASQRRTWEGGGVEVERQQLNNYQRALIPQVRPPVWESTSEYSSSLCTQEQGNDHREGLPTHWNYKVGLTPDPTYHLASNALSVTWGHWWYSECLSVSVNPYPVPSSSWKIMDILLSLVYSYSGEWFCCFGRDW